MDLNLDDDDEGDLASGNGPTGGRGVDLLVVIGGNGSIKGASRRRVVYNRDSNCVFKVLFRVEFNLFISP